MTSRTVLIDRHPGRSSQSIGVARALGTDPDLIHEPSVGVVGTKGDSQCYFGVMSKVDAIHDELKGRIGSGQGQLKLRLVQPDDRDEAYPTLTTTLPFARPVST